VAEENGVDVTESIKELEARAKQVRRGAREGCRPKKGTRENKERRPARLSPPPSFARPMRVPRGRRRRLGTRTLHAPLAWLSPGEKNQGRVGRPLPPGGPRRKDERTLTGPPPRSAPLFASRLVVRPSFFFFFNLPPLSSFQQLRRDTYSRLTPVQRLQVARHPNRPTFLDIALNISDKFVELHGDRAGLDDPAMVCGLASIDGVSFMFIGHQKGRNTKENIYRNFGMPQPNGYRKALRFMRHADHFGFPIVTFVDTPGAYAGKAAEELGQGEAIAVNLREMFGFRVPIISVVIGEGGSGGALAIG